MDNPYSENNAEYFALTPEAHENLNTALGTLDGASLLRSLLLRRSRCCLAECTA